MKRSKHQLLWSLAAALLAGTFLVSCSEDDALSSGTLLEGKYPLVLTAEIDGEATRASGKDAFAENDEIGVMLGTATGKYVIGSDGKTLSPYDTDNTIYWQKLEATTVTGWYPYDAQTSVTISDQSSGYAAYDYLTATAENQAVGNTVKLKFKHQMAKVTFTLTKGTDMDMENATVKVFGYTIANFSQGVLTGETNGEITPIYSYDSSTLTGTGEVLLVPQDMSNQQFIEIIDNTNSTTYYYTPTSANLEAGGSYTFNINVGGDYIYDSTTNTYTVFTEVGLNAWATAAATDMTTDCILGNDITMSGTWTAVGTSIATSDSYAGTFDGNNCTIKNLTISSDAVAHQGLIGYMGSGTVKDLTLVDVSITNTCTTTGSTGAVVGYNNGGTVSDCTVSGSVTGTNNVGGVVGNNASGSISNCSSSATVEGAQYTGGVAGLNGTNGTITNSYSTGAVTGTGNYTGGVVGNNSGNVTACYYSTETVSGTSNVGGVAGLSSGSLTACYSTGAVSASSVNSGGIVGNNQGTITACYSSGAVTSTGSRVGGAVGYNQSSGTITACYWSNSQSSGVGSDLGSDSDVNQVTDSNWSDAATDMNEELTDWEYVVNEDTSGAPLTLQTASSS